MSELVTVSPTTIVAVWLASILMLMLAVVLAIPVAFFLMLFLGNLGIHLGFVACIPGGIVLSSVRSRISTDSK